MFLERRRARINILARNLHFPVILRARAPQARCFVAQMHGVVGVDGCRAQRGQARAQLGAQRRHGARVRARPRFFNGLHEH
jgi:hypothetical protein